ncbi:hypothetical protein ACFQL7_20660 [Halocatena marina]|uniref:Uncharacterized protein n=1 Tax=Halocatena marina TaxID=2934937 RepID=A0ABD5YRG3_9EURY|nr:hypothetical protein [Halocatena marina]
MTNEEPETESDGVNLDEVVQQSHEFHSMLDNMKRWSGDVATQILINRGDTDEESEIERHDQALELVRSVAQRIEQGDNQRARRP